MKKFLKEWAILKWWIGDSAVIGKLFAGLLLVLSVGSQMLAKLHTKIWSLLGICLLCLGGTVAAVLFLIYGNDPALDIFKQFRSVAGGAPDALRSSISTALYATIAWLLSFMCVQLGISYKNAEGALKKLTD